MAEVKKHRLAIVGAGPAALSAAIYTTREDIDTILLEKGVVGGLAAITDNIENYPGFAKGIEGLELASQLRQQAERFGAKIDLAEVHSLEVKGKKKLLTTSNGEYEADCVLIATGNDYKKAGVKNEAELFGRGVHYCATCDGALYRDKKLIVIGGGNSATQEALFLTKFATHIDLLVRKDAFRASDVLVKKVLAEPKITVHYNTTADEIIAKDMLVSSVKVTKEGKPIELQVDGVFVFVGLVPNTQWLEGSGVKLDERGFVLSDKNLHTNLDGVFVAGDVRADSTEQIASAVGEGATSALKIREYLEGNTLEA